MSEIHVRKFFWKLTCSQIPQIQIERAASLNTGMCLALQSRLHLNVSGPQSEAQRHTHIHKYTVHTCTHTSLPYIVYPHKYVHINTRHHAQACTHTHTHSFHSHKRNDNVLTVTDYECQYMSCFLKPQEVSQHQRIWSLGIQGGKKLINVKWNFSAVYWTFDSKLNTIVAVSIIIAITLQ